MMHLDKDVSYKLKRSVFNRWNRHNFHWEWYKKYRNMLKEKIFDKLNND